MTTRAVNKVDEREGNLDWQQAEQALADKGFAVLTGMVPPEVCVTLATLYSADIRFRSRVVMERHGFGRGEYKYFAHPLPEVLATLRRDLYVPLAAIANRWNGMLGQEARYPPDHGAYLALCHAAGQMRPTPLLLRYEAGDYNCLHQDIYGELVFPLQATLLLSRPGLDFTGGELVLTEQRPHMQSRASVVPLALGDMVIFPVRHRPVQGTKGIYRVNMRHGVSTIRSGIRHTAGIIFHDAA